MIELQHCLWTAAINDAMHYRVLPGDDGSEHFVSDEHFSKGKLIVLEKCDFGGRD